MKIILASYRFYPENTPLAFRTFELAKEFARQKHSVSIYIPDYDFDYSTMEQRYHFKIKKVRTGFLFNRNAKKRWFNTEKKQIKEYLERLKSNRSWIKDVKQIKNVISKYVKKSLRYVLPEGHIWEYSIRLKKALLSEAESCDMIISISYPFPVHIGVASALRSKPQLAKVSVAEFEGPFYYYRYTPKTFYFKMIEKSIVWEFNYIVVPTKKAVNTYLVYKGEDKIKVIPQGFDFSDVKTAYYKPNKVPTFIFAGAFYKGINNPSLLFEHLVELDLPFRFIVYARPQSDETFKILKHYMKKMGDKLIVKPAIPRIECIYELSKADFLINADAISPNHSPSKIIDYALAGRPIFSFTQNFFDPSVFNQFLNGAYRKRLRVDLNNYKIENVCNKFLNLYHEKN